ncbi:MAG: glycosyltransferase family 39 protein [Bdellovibrionota bacterium]
MKNFLVFFLLSLLARIVFSHHVGLIDDEAYHWTWSQDLMLSYYDHPGMIAWLERISTMMFGNTIWGVRLPSFICYVLAVYFMWQLTKQMFDEAAACFVGAIMLWSPFWGFGGYVASPEPPFMLCWVLACYIFWQGTRPDDNRWSVAKTWILLGLVMGLGLNSKFIIALLAPGFGLYLLFTRQRRDLLTRWPWVGFLIATLLCIPIFAWNIDFDWPGFRYQFHDRHTGESFSFARWIKWFGIQFFFYTPVLYPLLLLSFGWAFKNRKTYRWAFLFYLTLPSMVIFYVQPFFADYKPHWAGAAHLILLMGAGAFYSHGLKWGEKYLIGAHSSALRKNLIGFHIFYNILVYSPFLGPWVPTAYNFVKDKFNLKENWETKWDFSNEFTGWEDLGQRLIDKQRFIYAETGRKPHFAALRYETTAQTWWGSKEKTYMMSSTRSHYTVTQFHRGDFEKLKGSDFLVVTTEKYQANPFEYADWGKCTPEYLKTFRANVHARTFTIWYCQNFKELKN